MDNCSLDNCPPDYWPQRQLPPRKIAPQLINREDNYPRGELSTWMIAPGLLLSENYPKDNCPLTIYPWKLPPKEIAFRMIFRLHHCSSHKWPRAKLPSRKIIPRISYTRHYFSPRIRNCSILTDICFLLFLSLWFKVVLDFGFRIRKNFITTVRLKLLKKEE